MDVEGDALKYAEDFARLAEQLLSERHEQPTLDRIVASAVESVDVCDHCGITLSDADGGLTTAAASDPVAAQVGTLQVELGEGPCLEAAWDLDTVSIDDLTSEPRWPVWAPAAAALGLRSMLGLHLDFTGRHLVASLNLFSSQPQGFDSTDLAIASIFARHAAQALASVRTEDGLRAAVRSRQTIGVAQGMLIQRFGLTLDQSFELLRRYSQTHNVKLRDLAERLVQSGGISASDSPAASLDQAFGLTTD